MAELIEDASRILDAAPLGVFSIDKKSAASCFTYPVQIPILSQNFSVELSLIYNSQTVGDLFLGKGWHLAGCDDVDEVTPGVFYQQGEQCEPSVIKGDKICFYDREGIKTTYARHLKSNYQLVKRGDVYENECVLEYDRQARPHTICYGVGANLKAEIRFTYDEDTGKLVSIKSQLPDTPCFETRLSYENDTLTSLTSIAFNEGASFERRPNRFAYNDETSLLSQIWYRNDGDITITYQPQMAAVTIYEETTKLFRGRKKIERFDVISKGWIEPRFNFPFFETISIWSRTARMGSTWVYNADPQYQGLLKREIFGKILNTDGSVEPLKESCYVYQYLAGTITPIVSQITSLDWSLRAAEPQKNVEVFEYNDKGNLICASDGKTMTRKTYQYTPSPFETPLLTSKILYDVTKSAALSDDHILRAEKTSYQIDNAIGAVKKRSHQFAISATVYANPAVTKLDNQGRTKWHCAANGTYHHYEYDLFGFVKKETICTEDKAKSIANSFQYCPKNGKLIKEINCNGAIRQNAFDAFGELTTEFQSSIADMGNNPETLKQQTLKWDAQLNVFVSRVESPVGNDALRGVEINLFDGLMRPLANAIEIEADQWQVELVTYCIRTKRAAQSLPFEVRASAEELPQKLHRRRNLKIRWTRTYFDEVGRTLLVKLPDGSKKTTHYFIRKCGTTLEETRTYGADGQFIRTEQREMSKDGQLTERLTGESEPSRFCYDLLGQLTSRVTAKNETLTYKWDLLGNCTSENHSTLGLTTQPMGPDLQIHQQHKNDQVFSFERDWLGRLVRCHSVNPNNEISEQRLSYEIDPDTGINITTFQDEQDVEIRTGYSPFGVEVSRKLRIRDQQFSPLRTTYWPNSQVRTRLFPDGRTMSYSYDPRGFVKSVTQEGSDQPIVVYEGHDFQGQARKATFANGVVETKTANDMGSLTSFKVASNTLNSQQKTLISQSFGHMQGYPATLAIKSEEVAGFDPRKSIFHYDESERLSHISDGSTHRSVAVNQGPSDQPNVPLERDAFGQVYKLQTENKLLNFEHDALGRLHAAQVQQNGSIAQFEYSYFPAGNMLQSRRDDGTVISFIDKDYQHEIYANGDECSTLKVQGDQGAIAELTHFISKSKQNETLLLAPAEKLEFVQKREGEIYIHLDGQASSILATNSRGEAVANLLFCPFGEIDYQNSTGDVCFDVVYSGMRFDPNLGLYVTDTRVYCPERRQFLSSDPIRATSDLFAYPADPVNYFDANGLCPRPNYCRSFQDNYGRSTNLKGGVFATAINCFAVFLPVYLLLFGYDLPTSLRWTIGLGAWFLTASLLGSVCVHINRSYGGEPDVPETHLCGRAGLVFAKSLVSVGIATAYLGPMLSFIGNEECEPYQLLNCSPDFYHMNIIRGLLATSIASPLGGVMAEALKGSAFRNRSLVNRYATSLASLWFSYGIWQFFDILQLKLLYGRNPGDVLHFKRAFLSGEIFLGLLMAQPNPFLGLLPALFHCQKWDFFFSNRPETATGEPIPWFAQDEAERAQAAIPSLVQIEIIETNDNDTEAFEVGLDVEPDDAP